MFANIPTGSALSLRKVPMLLEDVMAVSTWMKILNLLSKCVTMTSRLLYFPSVCLCQESTKVILVSHWRDNVIFTSRSSSESASIESRSGVYGCVQGCTACNKYWAFDTHGLLEQQNTEPHAWRKNYICIQSSFWFCIQRPNYRDRIKCSM